MFRGSVSFGRRRIGWVALALLLALPAAAGAENLASIPDKIDFNRDVRPFLSETCFKCHGFDPAARKAKLRLDTVEGATAVVDGHAAIVPGKPEESEGYRRLTTQDADDVMPPLKSGLKLTPRQVAVFRRWIEQGAHYKPLWSFIPPLPPDLPRVKDGQWCRNGIDRFILERLEREGLTPSPEAGKETLIRRVTLDLTGLPPTPAEVDSFVLDDSPDAYEKAVDRLLASPHYGERMAEVWLDAARYADTSGYQADWERSMWPWRDWVVRAYNENMPFDRFTIEQIAGDMLPHATLEQKIASGFNRNHRINDEAGIIPAEYAAEYVVDRVDTTSTVWLGLTVGCARCHDHKYDPIKQKEFYRLYAYFDNVPERGQDGRPGYAAPFLRVPPPESAREIGRLEQAAADLEHRIETETPASMARREQWEREMRAALAVQGAGKWSGQVVRASAPGAALMRQSDGSVTVTDITDNRLMTYELTIKSDVDRVTAVRLEVLADDHANGRLSPSDGNFQLNDVQVEVDPPGAGGGSDEPSAAADKLATDADPVAAGGSDKPAARKLKAGAKRGKIVKIRSAVADYSQEGHSIALAIDGKRDTGWSVDGDILHGPRTALFVLDTPIEGTGALITVRLAQGSKQTQQVMSRVRLSLTGDPDPALGPLDVLPEAAVAALKVDPARRSSEESAEVAAAFRRVDAERADLFRQLVVARRSALNLAASGTPVMVMQEMPGHRETYLLKRGQYDQPDKSEVLQPGVPASLLAPGITPPATRLEFARWLASPENPLTGRVAVNRFWQMYFGTGIVKTSEDFGAQGEWPSHPELLDFLATQFMQSKWDVKAMQKLIVTSAAYRQSSRATPALLERDPENRLIARGPRFRLDAFALRDNALAAAGLLVDKVGGPPVKPYQPPGLWEELAFSKKTTVDSYVQDKGESLYRRSLYTFWKRTVPPPALAIFDAAGREQCSVRVGRTNTPLQALNLLNDVTYVEAARALAQRMMHEGGTTSADRLGYGWRLVATRHPSEREAQALGRAFDRYLKKFQDDPIAAKALLGVGASARDTTLDPVEHAAYTAAANVLLNLDETLTKE